MQVYTVSQFNATIQEVLSECELFSNILIVGTITNLKRHSSGHYYFTIKDEQAAIDVALWKGTALRRNLVGKLENGLFVHMAASINWYEKTGRLSLTCNDITVEQISPEQLAFEALKKELLSLGYFDEAHKMPIPKLSTCIGIVTSESGAVLHDILQVGGKRNPLVTYKLFAVPVQGSQAGPIIAEGIRQAAADPDVETIIVGRGGGSAEDLWCFNDRAIVEAIYACDKPVISAVGHETDVTLCDFAADARASTPSHAAEMSVYPLTLMQEELVDLVERLDGSMVTAIERRRQALDVILRGTLGVTIMHTLHEEKRRLQGFAHQMETAFTKSCHQKQQALAVLGNQLVTLNPVSLLTKGYTRTEKDGQTIRSVQEVATGDTLHVTLIDGTIVSTVKEIISNGSEN